MPIPCDNDVESKTFPRITLRRMFMALAFLQNREDQLRITRKLEKLANEDTQGERKKLAAEIRKAIIRG